MLQFLSVPPHSSFLWVLGSVPLLLKILIFVLVKGSLANGSVYGWHSRKVVKLLGHSPHTEIILVDHR